MVIEFADVPGMEIRVRFVGDATGKLSISVDSVFRDGTAEIDLRSPRLARLDDEAQDKLKEARKRMQPAETAHSRAEKRVKEIKADEPLPNQPRRKPQWQRNYSDAKRQFDIAERELNAATQQEKESQARLESTSKIRAFMKNAQKQATIKYVVFSECCEVDLLLVDGSQ